MGSLCSGVQHHRRPDATGRHLAIATADCGASQLGGSGSSMLLKTMPWPFIAHDMVAGRRRRNADSDGRGGDRHANNHSKLMHPKFAVQWLEYSTMLGWDQCLTPSHSCLAPLGPIPRGNNSLRHLFTLTYCQRDTCASLDFA